mgnify:CR=1 FL=1
MMIKPKGFYLNQYCVEFFNNKEYNVEYVSKNQLAKLQRCNWIKIVRIKKLKSKRNDFFYEDVYNENSEERKL